MLSKCGVSRDISAQYNSYLVAVINGKLQVEGFRGIKRVMVFYDGGYIIKNLHDLFQNEKLTEINLAILAQELKIEAAHPMNPDFIRAYYDALPDNTSEISEHRKLILENIHMSHYFQLRKGRLAKSKNKDEPERQKRVDTLIAIDMLAKAYEDHYDVAVLVSGDDDFFDLVESVKDAGKRVYGVYFDGHISKDLQDSFDKETVLNSEYLISKGIIKIVPKA